MRYMKNHERIEVEAAQPPVELKQTLLPVPKHLKTELVNELIKHANVSRSLIFTRTKQGADVLARHLRERGQTLEVIHGDFRQKQRQQAVRKFRNGKVSTLIATNVAARGLDIEGISHVINYDVPDEAETYVHRIGRTARMHADGCAWTLVTPEDEPLIGAIEYLLGRELERELLPRFDYEVPAPDWAKPSVETLLRNANKKRSNYDRWKALTR